MKGADWKKQMRMSKPHSQKSEAAHVQSLQNLHQHTNIFIDHLDMVTKWLYNPPPPPNASSVQAVISHYDPVLLPVLFDF